MKEGYRDPLRALCVLGLWKSPQQSCGCVVWSSFCRQETWCSERSSHSPKVTQLANGRAGTLASSVTPSILLTAPAPQASLRWGGGGASQVWEPCDALVSIILDPLGPPPAHLAAQACVTLTNRTGFLCGDRRSCISASGVCDGVRTCPHGEDEDEDLCREFCPVRPLPLP